MLSKIGGPTDTVTSAQYLFHDYQEANNQSPNFSTERRGTNLSRSASGWVPPPTGFFKINVDAASGSSLSRRAISVIDRDHRGYVFAAGAFPLHYPPPVEETEAMAIRQALIFAVDVGFFDCVVESHCLPVVKMLTGEMSSLKVMNLALPDTRD